MSCFCSHPLDIKTNYYITTFNIFVYLCNYACAYIAPPPHRPAAAAGVVLLITEIYYM
jgi:hypothetical protein